VELAVDRSSPHYGIFQTSLDFLLSYTDHPQQGLHGAFEIFRGYFRYVNPSEGSPRVEREVMETLWDRMEEEARDRDIPFSSRRMYEPFIAVPYECPGDGDEQEVQIEDDGQIEIQANIFYSRLKSMFLGLPRDECFTFFQGVRVGLNLYFGVLQEEEQPNFDLRLNAMASALSWTYSRGKSYGFAPDIRAEAEQLYHARKATLFRNEEQGLPITMGDLFSLMNMAYVLGSGIE
jgi:hypothetical protein